MDNIRRMSSQTSSLAHWRKRLCTVFQGPNSGCKSRQGAPVFMSHRMALNIRRSSLRLRPLVSVRGFTSMAQLWPIFRLKCRVCSCQTSKQQKDEKSRTYLETAPRALSWNMVASSPEYDEKYSLFLQFFRWQTSWLNYCIDYSFRSYRQLYITYLNYLIFFKLQNII